MLFVHSSRFVHGILFITGKRVGVFSMGGWLRESRRLFLGVADLGAMADHAHDMGLMAVDGQGGVLLAVGLIPALQRLVQSNWSDPNHDIADNRFAGHQVASVDPPGSVNAHMLWRQDSAPSRRSPYSLACRTGSPLAPPSIGDATALVALNRTHSHFVEVHNRSLTFRQ